MQTRAAIVEMVRGLNVSDAVAVNTVDDYLHARAKALADRPEKQAEWVLAWAVNNFAAAMRLLESAIADDVRRAEITRSMMRGSPRFEQPNGFSGPEFSRTVDRRAVAAAAQETLRRVLQMYEAMAVDNAPAATSAPLHSLARGDLFEVDGARGVRLGDDGAQIEIAFLSPAINAGTVVRVGAQTIVTPIPSPRS